MGSRRGPCTEQLHHRSFHATAKQGGPNGDHQNEQLGASQRGISKTAGNEEGEQESTQCTEHFQRQYGARSTQQPTPRTVKLC